MTCTRVCACGQIETWWMPKIFDQSQSKPAADLKVEVKRLMFRDERPVPVVYDQAKFSMIMSAFHNYERQVSEQCGGAGVKVSVSE